MGLRCLIGHDFGEVLTDHDRRERGDEVVVTIREYRECDRCGETRIVSENKEVRHATPSDPVGTDRSDDAAEPPANEPIRDGSVEDVEADEDDGVILEDEPEGRARGAWPGSEAGGDAEEGSDPAAEPAEPSPWPTVEGEDEGFAAEPSDGRPLDDVQFGSGLTPEAAASGASGDASEDDAADVLEPNSNDDRDFARARPSPSPTGPQRTVAADAEFFCPQCEFSTPTEDSSLRPGDICPSCRLGYLTERER